MKPTVYMLIGVPGSGKSTWVSKNIGPDTVYASSDDYIEKYAKKVGKTYSEVFDEVIGQAQQHMTQQVKQAVEAGKDIIWDQTNTSAKARLRKLRMLPGYRAVAVVFPTPPKDVLDARLAARPGKSIPDNVMQRMINSLEMPSKAEGFDEIKNVKTF